MKFCSHFPYNTKPCINGHEYFKRQFAKRGIDFEALDNGRLRMSHLETGFYWYNGFLTRKAAKVLLLMSQEANTYDEASAQTVELGNQLADDDAANSGEIADGLLAGAIQYWLYSRQPCGDPACENCAVLCTAERRLDELLTTVRELAESSEYYHSPHDHGVGRA